MTVSLPKFSDCPVRETPKKQNCLVRPSFSKIVVLDRRPTRQTLLYYDLITVETV